MEKLEEIKRRLQTIQVCQNGFVRVEDVMNVINFVEGLMFKEKENETKENK